MVCLFDNCTFCLENINTPPHLWDGLGRVHVWRNLTWSPALNRFTNKLSYYYARLENVYLRLYRSRVVYRNSIHKFTIGCNYVNYTMEQFKRGIERLNALTKWNWFNAKVTKLEAGINCKIYAKSFYSKFRNFDGKDFVEMRTPKGSKVYGSLLERTEYDFAIYDKRFQVLYQDGIRLKYNLLRIELKIKDMSCVRNLQDPIAIYTVNDLLNTSITKQIFQRIKSIIVKSTKKIERNFARFTNAELRTIASYENKEIFKQIKANSERSAEDLRRAYNKLMKV